MSNQQCGCALAVRARRDKRALAVWTRRDGRALRRALRGLLAVAVATLLGTLVGALPADAAPAHAQARTASALRPCDVFARGGTPCVAAYSTTRAMYARYRGPLYEVRRASDGATLAVGTLESGYADAGAQDRFCLDTSCEITELVDQSPEHNNLTIEGPGANGGQDSGVDAGALPVSIAGQQVYGMDFEPQMGYRDDRTRGVATGAAPESMYMVTAGNHFNSSCCFDFGNAETSRGDTGNGHMDAIYFGSACWLQASGCPPGGPWVQADLENGIVASDQGFNQDPAYTGSTSPFVTAVLENNGTSAFALAQANAQAGPLDPVWVGSLPSNQWDPDPPSALIPYPGNPAETEVVNPLLSGYAPMHKEGAIVLGTGGDNSNSGVGSFFEGAITTGVPSLVTEGAIQASIVAARYSTGPTAPAPDTPQFAVHGQRRQAVAAILCPVTCEAHITMLVQGQSARKRHHARRAVARVRVRSVVRTLVGASRVRLTLPRRFVRRVRRLGLRHLTATVTVRTNTLQPGAASVAHTVRLHLRL